MGDLNISHREKGPTKKCLIAMLMFLTVILLSCGSLFAGESDDPLKEFFADRRSLVEKIADDPRKFLEYVNAQKDVKARYKNETTLLHYAANRGYGDAAAILVKKGADVNARDKDGKTPLHEAMSYRRYDVARFLVENGADVNAKNKDADTPLISIVYMDDRKRAADLVTFFIAHDYDVKAAGNVRLLNESIRRGHAASARILLDNGAPFDNSSAYDAAMGGFEDIFNILLAKGASPSQKGILHAAAASGNVAILKTLVEKGMPVTRDDVDIAAFKGNRDAAVYLNQELKKTKDEEINIRSRCDLTPEGGNCMAIFEKGYYDKLTSKCRSFIYGGCGGTVPFDSVEACKKICE